MHQKPEGIHPQWKVIVNVATGCTLLHLSKHELAVQQQGVRCMHCLLTSSHMPPLLYGDRITTGEVVRADKGFYVEE